MSDTARPAAPVTDSLPLASLPAASLDPLNRLFRPRLPLTLAAGETQVELTLVPAPPPAPDAVWVEARLDGTPLAAALPRGLVRARLGADVAALADSELAGLVLEAALAPWLDAFERATGHGLTFARLGAGPAEAQMHVGLEVAQRAAGRLRVPIALSDAAAARLLAVLDLLPARPHHAEELPVPLHLRLAVASLPLAELASLALGDIVVAETDAALPITAVQVIAGERLATTGRLEEGGARLRLAGPLRPLSPFERESWTMTEGTESDVPGLDELPVRLAFELGRVEVSLHELRHMAAGQLLPLHRDPAAPVDILANGRRVGQGELVRLEGGLGVRIVRLFGHG